MWSLYRRKEDDSSDSFGAGLFNYSGDLTNKITVDFTDTIRNYIIDNNLDIIQTTLLKNF